MRDWQPAGPTPKAPGPPQVPPETAGPQYSFPTMSAAPAAVAAAVPVAPAGPPAIGATAEMIWGGPPLGRGLSISTCRTSTGLQGHLLPRATARTHRRCRVARAALQVMRALMMIVISFPAKAVVDGGRPALRRR